MNLNEMTLGQAKSEVDIHSILKNKGFVTNYNKKLNENGVDIVAIKEGEAYLIEVKKVFLNKTTDAFKLSDNEINGDILIAILPNGNIFPVVNEKTSFTKTIRFLMEL